MNWVKLHFHIHGRQQRNRVSAAQRDTVVRPVEHVPPRQGLGGTISMHSRASEPRCGRVCFLCGLSVSVRVRLRRLSELLSCTLKWVEDVELAYRTTYDHTLLTGIELKSTLLPAHVYLFKQ